MSNNEKNNWDKIARSFHVTSLNSRSHKDKYRLLASHIIKENPKNILDLGCGSGILEKALIESGYKGFTLGVDNSFEMLSIAKRYNGNQKNLEFKQVDLDRNFPTGKKYDIVVSINVFFFLQDKNKFLKNVMSVLSDNNSKFIMVTPYSKDQVRIRDYIHDHFLNTTLREKILIFINELSNLRHYFRMIMNEISIRKLENSGKLHSDSKDDLIHMSKSVGLEIISSMESYDKKGIILEMRRV